MTDYAGTLGGGIADDAGAQRAVEQATPGTETRGRVVVRSPWLRQYKQYALGTDVAAGLIGAFAAFLLRFGPEGPQSYLLMSIAAPVLWTLSVGAAHGYVDRYLGIGGEEYRALLHAAIQLVAAAAVLSYAFHAEFARGYVLVAIPATLVASLGLRCGLRTRLSRHRAAGRCLQSTVVVGTAESVRGLIHEIQANPSTGLTVVGACVSGLLGTDDPDQIEGVPIFGPPEQALVAVDGLRADVVAVSSHPDLVGHSLRRLGWALAERSVDLVVAPGIVEVAGPRLSLRPAAGTSLLHVERPTSSGVKRTVNRISDTVLSVALILCALPVMMTVAMLIRFDDRGPVLFRQERVGAGGATFSMFKFRTMVVDAEARLAELEATATGANEKLFKHSADPRITRVGRFLRRYSLDELPQLINVMRGEMSLVGPRPPLPREVALYEPDAVQRLRVRPGMTGLWQINGRSNLTWEQSLRLDLWYVDNWSPILDLQILVRTLRAVLKGTGAY